MSHAGASSPAHVRLPALAVCAVFVLVGACSARQPQIPPATPAPASVGALQALHAALPVLRAEHPGGVVHRLSANPDTLDPDGRSAEWWLWVFDADAAAGGLDIGYTIDVGQPAFANGATLPGLRPVDAIMATSDAATPKLIDSPDAVARALAEDPGLMSDAPPWRLADVQLLGTWRVVYRRAIDEPNAITFEINQYTGQLVSVLDQRCGQTPSPSVPAC